MHEVKSCNSRNLNESTLVAFDETAHLLKSNAENKVAKAMGLFFKVSQEERNGVYEQLYHLMPFAHRYWRCAEDAFLDRNQLKSTPEQKAQAIESYLTRMIAGAKLNPGVSNKAVHILFRRAVDLIQGGDVPNAMELFARMPRKQKEGVYEELLYLVSFDRDYQGCAEDAFCDRAAPEQRAQAIQNYLMQNIADLFKSGGERNVADAMDLFARMPKIQREGVFGEIYRLVRCTHDYWGCAEDAFYHRNGQSSAPYQKAQAIQNYLIKSRPEIVSPHQDKTVNVDDLKVEQLAIAEPQEDSRAETEKGISPEERVANRKSVHMKALEERCPPPGQRYCGDPKLRRGGISISRSSNFDADSPSYLVIANRGGSRYDRMYVSIDEKTGDLLCRGQIFESLEDMLDHLPEECPSSPYVAQEPISPDSPLARFAQHSPGSPISPFDLDDMPNHSPDSPSVPDVLQCPIPFYALRSPEIPISPFDLNDIQDLNSPIFFGGASVPVETKVDQIAFEPELDESELAFERDVADFVPLGKRSVLSIAFLKDLSIYKHGVLAVGNEAYLPVSGGTQNFSRQRLASCGSHPRREIFFFNPDNSPKLAEHYVRFRSGVQRGLTTYEVLASLKKYVRNEIFPSCLESSDLESEVKHNVDEARSTHPVATRKRNPSIKIPLMSIEDFIGKPAVCRHHGFVTVYMLDCLLNEEDPIIEGTAQLIRGNLTDRDGKVRGAHVWTTFIPKKNPGAPEEKFHLDTLWDELVNFAEDEFMLRVLYGGSMIDDQINRTNYAARINGQPEGKA